MAISRFGYSDIITHLKEILLFLEETSNEWRPIIPEADDQFHQDLVKYIRSSFKDKTAHQGEYAIIKNIIRSITQAETHLQEFIDQHHGKRSFKKNVKWLVVHISLAKNYRQKFNTESQYIRSQLDLLKQSAPPADQFKDDLSVEAYDFWTKQIGQAVTADWSQFSEAYSMLYGQGANIDLKYNKEVLLKENGRPVVTIYGFITLTREHGFPFERTPVHTPTAHIMSDEARMEVAKMIMILMADFSSAEMQENFLSVIQWYEDIPRSDRKGIEKSEKHKLVDRVDFARRAISFLYQRYMVMWRVGQLSRDTLRDVDFPGKARIKEFLLFVQPLDYANYHIVIGAEAGEWYHRKPNVYKFLEHLIINVSKDERRRSRETRQTDVSTVIPNGEKTQTASKSS
ncbi:hypothetical protein BJV82DRAFT_284340 [Fennellomyces sp. T-0311]|nr:hypothetical protein BJV82DRAFT_284340 [Fennellomyces sp. T-0311]